MNRKNDITGHSASGPLTELTNMLDAWGGAPARWPADVGRRIGEIVDAEPGAQTLLTQARALDRLLDRGRSASAQVPRGLADRIVAAAMAAPPAASTTAERAHTNVIALPVRPRPQAVPAMRGQWRTAALLAASLLVGIYLGGAVNLAPGLQDLADAIGLPAQIEPLLVASGEDLIDEDAL